jgi:hypothetical protein
MEVTETFIYGSVVPLTKPKQILREEKRKSKSGTTPYPRGAKIKPNRTEPNINKQRTTRSKTSPDSSRLHAFMSSYSNVTVPRPGAAIRSGFILALYGSVLPS